jgi:hypothetical protein
VVWQFGSGPDLSIFPVAGRSIRVVASFWQEEKNIPATNARNKKLAMLLDFMAGLDWVK